MQISIPESTFFGLLGILIGLIGILIALYFGIKQTHKKKIMRTFVQTIAAQSQSVANSIEELKNADFTKPDLIKGQIDATFKNMAALNGSIQFFYEKHYKKKSKKN